MCFGDKFTPGNCHSPQPYVSGIQADIMTIHNFVMLDALSDTPAAERCAQVTSRASSSSAINGDIVWPIRLQNLPGR